MFLLTAIVLARTLWPGMDCQKLESRLYAKTLELLRTRSRKLTLRQIAFDTKLPIGWLISISKPTSKIMPAVNRVECLFEYLSGQKLIP